MNAILQFAQAYWSVLSLGGIGAGLLAYVNRDLVLGKNAELPTKLPGVFRGEVLPKDDDDDTENEELRAALRLITCYMACSIDEPLEQQNALDACRTLKKRIPPPKAKPTRPAKTIENQVAFVAAVEAYNAADKITAVG